MTEQPHQAGAPGDPREGHSDDDPSTASLGDEERDPADTPTVAADPVSDQEPGADYG